MPVTMTSQTEKQPRHYLRQGSTSKKPLKEKLVQIYEAFFRVSCAGFNPRKHIWFILVVFALPSSHIAIILQSL